MRQRLATAPRPVRIHPAGRYAARDGQVAMLQHRNPVEVIVTVRTAQQLLAEAAERIRQRTPSQPGTGDRVSTARSRAMLDAVADLDALAAEIPAGVDLA